MPNGYLHSHSYKFADLCFRVKIQAALPQNCHSVQPVIRLPQSEPCLHFSQDHSICETLCQELCSTSAIWPKPFSRQYVLPKPVNRACTPARIIHTVKHSIWICIQYLLFSQDRSYCETLCRDLCSTLTLQPKSFTMWNIPSGSVFHTYASAKIIHNMEHSVGICVPHLHFSQNHSHC